MVIVKDNKNQYGILNINTDEEVLEAKYSDIQYIPVSGDFLVESNGKIGIKTATGQDKIKIQYDSIELINQELKMYVVKKDNKYGVINQNESTIIPLNCDRIGIEAKNFSKNNIKNKYVILDKIIPVMRNNLWGLYDIEGNGLANYQYDSFGCTSSSTRNTENVLVIPGYNVIVARKDKKYYLLNQYGEELLNSMPFDEVYMTIDVDEVKYYLVKDEKRYDAEKVLEKIKDMTTKQNNEENSSEEGQPAKDENRQDEENSEEQEETQSREEEQEENEQDEEDSDEDSIE